MKFFTRISQQRNVIIVAALLIAGALTVGVSFGFTKQANALSSVTDTESPTAPGIPTTHTPTNNPVMTWTWAPATDLPSDPTVASGIAGYQYRFVDASTTNGTVITDWTDVATTSVTTTAPYDGLFQLEVRAVDNAGNPPGPESVGGVQLDRVSPTVEITSPTNGTTVDATKKITIVGSTGDASSYTLVIGKTGQTPVVSVSGSSFSSYVWDTTNVPNNTYIATLTGADLAGNVSSVEVLIVVGNSTGTTTPPVAPTVTVNSAKYTSRPIVITGTVSSDPNDVITVTILDANNKVVETGTATYVPGQTTWSYTVKANLANGSYTVQARASNASGFFTDASAPITVSVQCFWLTLIESWFHCWFF